MNFEALVDFILFISIDEGDISIKLEWNVTLNTKRFGSKKL